MQTGGIVSELVKKKANQLVGPTNWANWSHVAIDTPCMPKINVIDWYSRNSATYHVIGRILFVFCIPGTGNLFVTKWVHIKHYGLKLGGPCSKSCSASFSFPEIQEIDKTGPQNSGTCYLWKKRPLPGNRDTVVHACKVDASLFLNIPLLVLINSYYFYYFLLLFLMISNYFLLFRIQVLMILHYLWLSWL